MIKLDKPEEKLDVYGYACPPGCNGQANFQRACAGFLIRNYSITSFPGMVFNDVGFTQPSLLCAYRHPL